MNRFFSSIFISTSILFLHNKHLKRKWALIAIFGLSVFLLRGQTADHIIDKELSTCLDSDSNYSTAAMADCFKIAAEKWDAELNIKYKEVLRHLSPSQKELFRSSQKQWIVFRDKEIQFSNQLYLERDGTAMSLSSAQTKLELTRQRTMMFMAYIADLTENDE
jgi:uncharacterized protein YecT (DUF1311 family)